MNDEQLFASFLDGARNNFEILVTRYHNSLYGYLFRYTGDANMAEEVFQETFVRILQKSHLYKRGRPFKPWLYQIATNIVKDKFREKKARPISLSDKEELVPKLTESPLQELNRKEIGQMIGDAIAKLPDIQRQVFVLREYDKLPYAQISSIVKRPLNTVKSDMRRALQSLRALLNTLADLATEGEV